MVEGRRKQETGAGSTNPPPFSKKRFDSPPEFANFKEGMKRLLAVPKTELYMLVKASKEMSARAGNPKAAGRKPKLY
jgi:hypothetical protein